MDEATLRAALTRHLELTAVDTETAHEIYHDDAVLEFPQSGERFIGVQNIREWRALYPAKVEYELRRIRGGEDFWVVELLIRYDDGPWNFGIDILELRDDKIARESIYVAEGWDPPDWRAPWRAEP